MYNINLDKISLSFPIITNYSLKTKISEREYAERYINVFNDFSLKIKKGEKLAIIGANGAGKTTLLRIMAGIYKPNKGSVTVNGDVASFLSLGVGTNPDSTGIEHIRFRCIIIGVFKLLDEKRISNIIEFAGLDKYIYKPLRTYSSGMIARLEFAIITEFPKPIFLMDEWLAVGDAEFREKAEIRMNSIIGPESTLVLASHSLPHIKRTCHKYIKIENGQIIHFGETADLESLK